MHPLNIQPECFSLLSQIMTTRCHCSARWLQTRQITHRVQRWRWVLRDEEAKCSRLCTSVWLISGARGSAVALGYKPEGHGFETRRDELIFSIFQPHWTLGFTHPVTEISIRNSNIVFLGSRARPVRGADNLTANCVANVGSSTSHKPIGLHGLLQG
jgi:hypothetical protein